MTAIRATAILTGLGAGWWLFADTAAHYWDRSRPDRIIRFAHYGGYQDYETWKQVIRAFESEHPQITVKQEYIPGYGTEYDNKLRRQLLAGVAADVFMVQDESFPHYAQNSLTNLSQLIGQEADADVRSVLHPTATESFMHDGALHALPLFGGNLLIYVNLRCLEKAMGARHAVPLRDDWTTDEFRQLCRRLTCDFDGDGRADQYGLWHPWWGYYLPFLWSSGAQVLDESRTEWRLTGQAAHDALQLYRDLLLVDKVCPAPGELGQMRQDIAFLSGKVAMVINGPWFIPLLEESELRDDYYVMHIPTGPAGRFTRVTWDGMAVNRHISERRQENAILFVLFATSKTAQDIFAKSRRVIPARSESRVAFSSTETANGIHKFVTSFDYLRVQPITEHWKIMDRAIKRHLQKLLGNQVTTAEFLTALKQDRDISSNFVVP